MEFENPHIRKFLSDPVFVQLVRNGSDDSAWKEYGRSHRDQIEAMTQARLIILAEGRFPTQQLDDLKKKQLWEEIERRSDREQKPAGRVYPFWKWLAAAAVVVVMLGIGWQYGTEQKSTAPMLEAENEFREIFNNLNGVFPVDLPDGSTVLLAPNSKVSYSVTAFESTGKREVSLVGEAFFEVVGNPEMPFYVYVNGLVTKVLGTSFNVRAFPDDQKVEVVVRTGRVTVFTPEARGGESLDSEPLGEIVNPDERIILDRSSRLLSLDKLVPPPMKEQSFDFVFDDQPVTEVFKELEKRYKIRIQFQEDLLSDCRITATLADETLYEKIRLICRGLNATYRVVEGEIVIESDGCS